MELNFEIQKDKVCLANQGQSLLSSVRDFHVILTLTTRSVTMN